MITDVAYENFSYVDYLYYRDHAQSFDSLAAFPYQITKARLAFGDRKESGMMEVVSDNYFQTMGLAPALGQLFHPGADESRASLARLASAIRAGSDGAPIPRSSANRCLSTLAQ